MSRPRPDRRYLLLLLVIPVIALGTCGGGDDAFRTDRPALRVTLDEYSIAPQDVELTTRTGRIKFIARNAGRLPHNFVIQVPAESEDEQPVEVGRTDTAQPGEEPEPIKLTLEPGEYRMVCTIANHDDLGQYGELRVEE